MTEHRHPPTRAPRWPRATRAAPTPAQPPARLAALFPQGTIRVWRVTPAPPLARAVCRIHPALYPLLGSLWPLRTHALAWIGKPR